MIKLTKTLNDPSGIVKKLIFEDNQGAIAESVVYNYKDRGVVCFSVQSGCPVGCAFCGTGKRFIRNLASTEIIEQMFAGIDHLKDCNNIQLMSMSMGEPMLNYTQLMNAWNYIDTIYDTSLYISTVGLRNPIILGKLLDDGACHKKLGLQFSLHHWDDRKRRKLLGSYPDLMSVSETTHYARLWSIWTGKPTYFNYICTGKETREDAYKVSRIVEGNHLTCSVLCNTNGLIAGDPKPAINFSSMILDINPSIDISVFDPAGQDTIGGGCGQLLYVQEKLNHGIQKR
jgi:23S rRNA (adenine2503-C2)-methyltransferase